MIEVGKLRKGMPLLIDGEIYIVLEANKHSMGRGDGIIRTRMKNLKTALVRQFTFQASEKVEEASLSIRHVQYLYSEEDFFHFMDLETFEQYTIGPDEMGDGLDYLKGNEEVDLQFHEDRPIGVILPNTVVLQVTETAPAYKGDTVSGSGKPAVLETGLKVTVPFFVENGEMIRVDTRTGEYIERA